MRDSASNSISIKVVSLKINFYFYFISIAAHFKCAKRGILYLNYTEK